VALFWLAASPREFRSLAGKRDLLSVDQHSAIGDDRIVAEVGGPSTLSRACD